MKIKPMKKLMHVLFLSCVKATELIEKKIHFRLTLKQKIQLRAHKTICHACSRYEKQSVFIDKAMKHAAESNADTVDVSELKKETLAKIEKLKQDS